MSEPNAPSQREPEQGLPGTVRLRLLAALLALAAGAAALVVAILLVRSALS